MDLLNLLLFEKEAGSHTNFVFIEECSFVTLTVCKSDSLCLITDKSHHLTSEIKLFRDGLHASLIGWSIF